jgi:hypothetical protein
VGVPVAPITVVFAGAEAKVEFTKVYVPLPNPLMTIGLAVPVVHTVCVSGAIVAGAEG